MAVMHRHRFALVVAFVAVACDDGATTTDGATSTGSGSSSASTGTSGLSCAEVDPQCPDILASAPCGGDPRGTADLRTNQSSTTASARKLLRWL